MGVYLTEKTAVAYVKKLLKIDHSFRNESVGAITNGIRGVVYFRGNINNVRHEIRKWLEQETRKD